MRRILGIVDEHGEMFLVVALYVYFLSMVILEVTLRYVFNSSVVFAAETARYAFIWLSWIAASYAVKNRLHLSIKFFESRTRPKRQFAMNLCYNMLYLVLSVYAIWYSIPIIASQFTYGTLSIAARIPMYLIFLIIPFGYSLLVVRVVQSSVVDYLDIKAGRPIRGSDGLL